MVWLGYHWWHLPLEMATIVYEREIGDDDGYELKTSFQITTSRFRNYFVIIPICFVWKLLASCVGSKFLWTVLKQKKNEGKTCRHALTFLKLMFCSGRERSVPNVNRTYRAVVFAHLTHCFVSFSLPLPSSFFFLTKDGCGVRWMFFFFSS